MDDIKIAIFGWNELVREGLRKILGEQGFDVRVSTASLDEILESVGEFEIALIDEQGFSEGIAACEALRSVSDEPRIVLMADGFSTEQVTEAFQSGVVDGYVLKDIPVRSLAGSLRLVATGEKVFPAEVIKALPSNGRDRDGHGMSALGFKELSSREIEILTCLVNGDPNKIISRRLNISDATVKVHIKTILRKLRLVNRTQAAIWAVSQGLAAPHPGVPS